MGITMDSKLGTYHDIANVDPDGSARVDHIRVLGSSVGAHAKVRHVVHQRHDISPRGIYHPRSYTGSSVLIHIFRYRKYDAGLVLAWLGYPAARNRLPLLHSGRAWLEGFNPIPS